MIYREWQSKESGTLYRRKQEDNTTVACWLAAVLEENRCWINPGERGDKRCCCSVRAGQMQPAWLQQRLHRETIWNNVNYCWGLRSCAGRSEALTCLTIFIKVWNWAAGMGCNHSVATSCPLIHPPLSFYFHPLSPGVTAGLSQSMETHRQTHQRKRPCISMPQGLSS